MIEKATNNQNITGVILVRNYGISLTKKGDEFEAGTLLSGTEIGFKAWNNSSAFSNLKAEDYTNCPVQITGKFNEFNGQMSIIIDTIMAVEGFTIDQFLPVKYNIEGYWNALTQVAKQKTSEYAYSLLDRILFSNKEVSDSFKIEFAASHHHDNCKSGLLAHTFKVVNNLNHLLTSYPAIVKNKPEVQDCLFVGAILHDLGKIREMNLGVYQSVSRVTHRYLGAEYIAPYKDEIIEHYSEDWYYNLISIILQHHGEWAEPCSTVYSYIIHKADELDAIFTDLVEGLESPQEDPTSSKIKIDGKYLMI